MKALFALTTLTALTLTLSVHAETVADGGYSFMLDSDTTESAPAPVKRIEPKKVEPKIEAKIEPKLESKLEPKVEPKLDPKPVSNGIVPYQATLGALDQTGCPDVVPHPNARNTPVKVYVDQETQTISIDSPDLTERVSRVVSTGGTLKIPNGKTKSAPYCARTKAIDRKIISAVTEDMFQGTTCTPDQIRAKSTVFPMYYSSQFADSKGNPSPMAHAIRINDGGIFLHQVGAHYVELLGKNVSGGCVRLTPKTAEFLQAQILKYGAIEVTVTEPPMHSQIQCNEQMVADAIAKQEQGRLDPTQVTGAEDVTGGVQNFKRWLDAHPNAAGLF